jgi:hypothetical protein
VTVFVTVTVTLLPCPNPSSMKPLECGTTAVATGLFVLLAFSRKQKTMLWSQAGSVGLQSRVTRVEHALVLRSASCAHMRCAAQRLLKRSVRKGMAVAAAVSEASVTAAGRPAPKPEADVTGMTAFLDSLKYDSAGLVAAIVQASGWTTKTVMMRWRIRTLNNERVTPKTRWLRETQTAHQRKCTHGRSCCLPPFHPQCHSTSWAARGGALCLPTLRVPLPPPSHEGINTLHVLQSFRLPHTLALCPATGLVIPGSECSINRPCFTTLPTLSPVACGHWGGADASVR